MLFKDVVATEVTLVNLCCLLVFSTWHRSWSVETSRSPTDTVYNELSILNEVTLVFPAIPPLTSMYSLILPTEEMISNLFVAGYPANCPLSIEGKDDPKLVIPSSVLPVLEMLVYPNA